MTGRRSSVALSPGEDGFTLIEMMIALLIFGLISAAGAAILSFSVRAQAATTSRLDDVAAVQRLSSALAADLAQAVDRPTRDATGAAHPSFVGARDASVRPMLSLVRGGWTNLDDAPRAGAQRVDYAVEDGKLVRIAYPQLDGAVALAPAVLLPAVASVTLRYRLAGAWGESWTSRPGNALPDAAEMIVTRRDGTTLRLMLLVGTGYVRPIAPAGGGGGEDGGGGGDAPAP